MLLCYLQTASIANSRPRCPPAATLKICHPSGQPRKDREDRRGTAAGQTREVCSHSRRDSPRSLPESPAPRGDRRLPGISRLRTAGEQNASRVGCRHRGLRSRHARAFVPAVLITGKGASSGSEPVRD